MAHFCAGLTLIQKGQVDITRIEVLISMYCFLALTKGTKSRSRSAAQKKKVLALDSLELLHTKTLLSTSKEGKLLICS